MESSKPQEDAKPPAAMHTLQELEKNGHSRAQLYREINSGRLIARKLGRRTVVLAEDYQKFLQALPVIERRQAS